MQFIPKNQKTLVSSFVSLNILKKFFQEKNT